MAPTKAQVAARLPSYRGDLYVYVDDQDTPDIVDAIMRCHKVEKKNFARICDLFDAPSGEEIGQNCFDFLKDNFRYHAEDENLQTVRSPSATVATGYVKGLDCKNYSIFTGGIIDALNREGAGVEWCYRFAAYSKMGIPNKYLKHVFIVLYPDTEDEIWVDPVLSYFNSRERQPCYHEDVNPNKYMLGKLSGVPGYRQTMGQDDGTGDMASFDPSSVGVGIASYDPTAAVYDTSGTTSTDTSGTTVDVNALPSTYVQSGPDLTSPTDFNPSTATVDLSAADQSNTYEEQQLAAQVAAETSGSSGNFVDNLLNSLFKPSAGTGTGAGGGGGAPSKPAAGQTPTGGTVINVGTGTPTTSTNTTTWLIIGGIAVVGILAFVMMKKK